MYLQQKHLLTRVLMHLKRYVFSKIDVKVKTWTKFGILRYVVGAKYWLSNSNSVDNNIQKDRNKRQISN